MTRICTTLVAAIVCSLICAHASEVGMGPAEVEATHRSTSGALTVVNSEGAPIQTIDRNGMVSSVQAPSSASGGGSLSSLFTIDQMSTYAWDSHGAGDGIAALGSAQMYYLSDGSSWSSGAGSYTLYSLALHHVEVSGDVVRYVMVDPGVFYQQTDYDDGDHSAQGTLAADGPLVLEATIGSTTAVLEGGARIVSNEPTYYGDRFHTYTALVGSVVPFRVTYTLTAGTWNANAFDQTFGYYLSGWVDFADPISVPQLQSLSIGGSAEVASEVPAQFQATAMFEGDIARDVTGAASWSVQPATLATIDRGLLIAQPITTDQETLIIHAEYTANGVTAQTNKSVILRRGGSAEDPQAWQTYQGNPKHTGFVPMALEPDNFSLRWQRTLGNGFSLNPVTAADDLVFVSGSVYFNSSDSFFVLDAIDGETLWSRAFDDPFSVNPPAYAYGNVYIQTGNHSSDTYLWAFDASTGQQVFKSPHSAQWERYYAPTIDNGTVFINGGYYGGMYAFDAFSGQQKWFRELPQYDQWTPAVAGDYAYAYVERLYAADRTSGAIAFTIPDPGFNWQGWSMGLAPVLGGQNDLLVIQAGRLVSFDLMARSIRYTLSGGFIGQPTVKDDIVYAIRSGAMVALSEGTGNQLWSWTPPVGALTGTLIVTNTHVLAATSATTYAIDILSRETAWSYPAGGYLALGNETLYIAGTGGLLTAIAMPEYSPASLDYLELIGPASVTENSTAQYTARVHYDDGRVRTRTTTTQWSVEPAAPASFADYGVMNVGELFDLYQDVVVHGRYTEGANTVEASLPVRLVVGVTPQQFYVRNLEGATAIKMQILQLLDAAQIRERAVAHVASSRLVLHISPSDIVGDILDALRHDDVAKEAIVNSLDSLREALEEVGKGARRERLDPSGHP